MAKRSLWDDVDLLRNRGEKPQITFPLASKIIEQQVRPPGRPRVRPVGAPCHYGYKLRTPAGGGMRCRAPRCRVRLRKYTKSICCSERCELELRAYCETNLAFLNKRQPVDHYPTEYRSNHTRVQRPSCDED